MLATLFWATSGVWAGGLIFIFHVMIDEDFASVAVV